MTEALRLGLAGLGSMGSNHLRVIGAHPDTQLVAVADPVPGLSGSGPDPRTVLAFGLSGLAILLGALLIVGPSVARRLPRRR